ncbi:hypothetical protein PR048_010487 [Dryococelus australis]|uniref:Uncharacterized protein n=1 Tax=Dryococelus australis TaxID=614101 RepID=A0ABQ9I4V1_9NEOP|nr:hypothetical protein PR048_010487 [Dryococelus australis]
MKVIEVSTEQCWNEGMGETGDPRENPLTSGIVRHNPHFRKSGIVAVTLLWEYCQFTVISHFTEAMLKFYFHDIPPSQTPQSSAYWSLSCVFIGCCPAPGTYGIRKVFPCKSAIGSDACKAGLINCDPIAKRLHCSPSTKVNRVQSSAGSPDFRMWESCRTVPLIGGFYRGSPVYPAPSFGTHRLSRSRSNIRLTREHLANPITTRCGATANEYTAEAPVWRGLGNYSPPTTANRVQFQAGAAPAFPDAGIVSDVAAGRRFSSGTSRFPGPCFPAPIRLISPSSVEICEIHDIIRHQAERHCDDKIDFKRVYTEVTFANGSEFIMHALKDSEPIAKLQGHKKQIPYCQVWGKIEVATNEQISEARLYKGLPSLCSSALKTSLFRAAQIPSLKVETYIDNTLEVLRNVVSPAGGSLVTPRTTGWGLQE